jgi:hypothetical protein
MRIYHLAGMGAAPDPQNPPGKSDDPTDDEPTQLIKGVRAIEAGEWERIHAAFRQLHHHRSKDHLFWIYDANAAELSRFLDHSLRAMELDPKLGAKQLEVLCSEANRHILNLLGSMRTFLDHTETDLKRRFGKDSPQTAAFKKECSRQYDCHFAYRFLSKFRNYAQHCGLPVGIFSVTQRSHPRPPSQSPSKSRSHSFGHQEITLSVDPRGLLEDFPGWGAKVRGELEKKTGKLELVGLLRQLHRSVHIIHSRVQNATRKLLRSEIRLANSLVREVYTAEPGMFPTIISYAESTGGEKAQFRFHHFPLSIMSELLPKDDWLHALSEAAR